MTSDASLETPHSYPGFVRTWPAESFVPWATAATPTDRERDLAGFTATLWGLQAAIRFEALLIKGLAHRIPMLEPGSPEFEYSCHEMAEEALHSRLFGAYVDQSGSDLARRLGDLRRATGPGPFVNAGTAAVSSDVFESLLGSIPELFFFGVISGEMPGDIHQRHYLRAAGQKDASLEALIRYHVRDEGRHIAFARGWLLDAVPRLGHRDRTKLAHMLPYLVAAMLNELFVVPKEAFIEAGVRATLLIEPTDHELDSHNIANASLPIAAIAGELGLIDGRLARRWARQGLETRV